ncbi:hypothetical protein AGDE_09286 [Angomonas deanei]|nr:hypothetical protein AGDE_09286 [Angomonas deanei]|eukprot:EPY30747.1 hypothetical protein AGDE_09286 [Angomonas deanei]
MFFRGPNEAIARSEGFNVEPELSEIEKENKAPYKMTLYQKYVDPNHKNTKRPVVDVSAPFNVLDETHQSRRFGTQKMGAGHLSLAAFTGTHEEVPYTETYHNTALVAWWMTVLNTFHFNKFVSDSLNSHTAPHPRVKGAMNIAFLMSFIRINIAGLIGTVGYFYSYEYLYTHGPSLFRINDPTPNGWKKAWQEGQSCYAARAVASIFPALGYAFFMGRWKKAAFWYGAVLVAGEYYEYARVNVLSGTRLFYSFLAAQDSERQAAWGSLTPNLKHRVDPDTNRNESVAQFRYLRLTSSPLQDQVWESIPHENLPFHRNGRSCRTRTLTGRRRPRPTMIGRTPSRTTCGLFRL